MTGGALLDDLGLAAFPGLKVMDIRMTLYTGEFLSDVVYTFGILAGFFFVTNAAINRLGKVDTLSMFLQIDDVHMTTGTGVGPVYRIDVLFPFYDISVTFQTVFSQDGSLHLDFYSNLTGMGGRGGGEKEQQDHIQQ
jgi:hypothetical protein